jgi:spore maturation protein CgeB
MKVLFTNEAPLIKYGLGAGFRQMGHDTLIMQGDAERLWGVSETEQENRLNRAIDRFRPDFIFTEGHPRFEPQVICSTARQHGIPHFYWAIEDPVCTDLTLKVYAPEVDYIFTTAVEMIPRYQALGKKAEVLLFGCNPEFHRFSGVHPRYRHDLVLVASNYSSRYAEAEWFIMPLVKARFDIRIWGIWWDDPVRPVNLCKYRRYYGGILPYEELPSVYSSAKIILGMNCDDSSQTQTSMRPFEALACGGGLYLGHYTKAQEYIFQDLIFQTHNTRDTLTRVRSLLGMSETRRRELAKKAQTRLYEQHSYGLRAAQIVNAFQNI